MSESTAERKVAAILYRGAAYAYGFPREHDEGPACEVCGGDGCERCEFTGEPS